MIKWTHLRRYALEENNSKLSIIVPIYNIEDYVEKCITSISESKYNNLEIILVDDGSTDDSGRICDQYSRDDNRIIVIHKANGGLVSARKAGVRVATGEFAAFVDGDDFVESNFFEQEIALMQKLDVDMINCGYKAIDIKNGKSSEILNHLQNNTYQVGLYDSYYDSNEKSLAFIHAAWNKMYKTSLLQKAIERVDDSVTKGEDLNLTFAYLDECKTFYVDNSICKYGYVDRSTSMTHTYDEKSILHTANYITSSLKLRKEGQTDWNKIIYNEAMNLIMSDCVGCALEHYGKKGTLNILAFFRELSHNEIICNCLKDALEENVYAGVRKRFSEKLIKDHYITAFIIRVLNKKL